MSGGAEPVWIVCTRILMRNHDLQRAIGPICRSVLIDMNAVIPIVERLKPVIAYLKVPVSAHG